MKKSWIVAGLVIATVVAVGIFILTTKNAEKQTTAKQSEIISGTEIMTAGNGSRTKKTKVVTVAAWRLKRSEREIRVKIE